MLGVGQSWAWTRDCTITVNAVGGGTVLASNTNSASGTYGPSSSVTGTISGNTLGIGSITQYLFAKANTAEGYEFVGWAESQNATTYVSTANPYPVKTEIYNVNGNQKKTYYAFFKRTYTATANAVAGIGGHASVNGNATQSVYITESSKTFNFSLVATAKAGYKFKGWSESEGGNIVSSNTNYSVSIICDSANPVIKTWYANFEPDVVQNHTTFTDPITNIDAADPAVILAQDGYYYAYCSESYSGEGIPVWRSSDMVNWTKITTLFANRPDAIKVEGYPENGKKEAYTFLWAPEIAYVNGKYVLYYANAAWGDEGSTQICVATSDNPYGPFEDSKVLISSKSNGTGAYNANVDNVIDPSLFRDDDGKNYLLWGSWHGIWYVELDANCTSIKSGESKHQFVATGSGNKGDWTKVEAPMVVKHTAADDGKTYYYLICSKGTTVNASDASGINYQMSQARGTQIGGTFKNEIGQDAFSGNNKMFNLLNMDKPTEYFVLGPGHSSHLIKDYTGKEWVYYHGYPKNADGSWAYPGGRKMFLDQALWDAHTNGWLCIWPYEKDRVVVTPTVDPKGPETYQIYNAADLVAFASKVNSGEVYASATLMNDIDMAGVNYTPIGTSTNKFRGVIDGQGYRIKNLTINGGDDTGLVAYANGGAQFRYIIIDASCSISGGAHTAAFLGRLDGSGVVQFFCCGNEATVTGGQNTAGFVGCDTGVSLFMDNCYNTGNINGGSESAAFSGWGIDRLRNCWNTGRTLGCQGAGDGYWFSLARDWNDSKSVNTYDLNADNAPLQVNRLANYDSSWMTNGHLTYAINQGAGNVVWYQNVDASFGDNKDPHPVFLTSHLRVYNDGNDYYNVPVENKYERPVSNSNYGTICIGYNTTRTENATFYKVVAVREKEGEEKGYSTIVIEELEEEDQQHLVGGVAYVFKPSGDNVTVTCYYNDGGYRDAVKAPGLVGNLVSDKMQIPAGDYILSNNQFRLVEQGAKAYIARNRAYISGLGYIANHGQDLVTNSSKVVCFGDEWNFDGDATGTESLEIEVRDKNAAMYNLAGQRITEPVPGQVYIQNGKKYIAR